MTKKLKVFIDADVLFAGAATPSKHSASSLILRLSEMTFIDGITSEQAVTEAARNLEKKAPQALPVFNLLIARSVIVTPDPTKAELRKFIGLADRKDLPILVAAIREECNWLVTFNLRDFRPGHPGIQVRRPGDFVLHARDLLAHM
jgi:predicted nucleic acid-binding protein